MKFKDYIDRFDKLLLKYKLAKPVALSAQESLIVARDRLIHKTLQQVGDYSLYYNLFLKVYIGGMKYGLKLSLLQAKIIVIMLLMCVVCSVSGASYLFIDYFYHKSSKRSPIIDNHFPVNRLDKPNYGDNKNKSNSNDDIRGLDRKNIHLDKKSLDKRSLEDKHKIVFGHYKLGIETFEARNVGLKEKEQVVEQLYAELQKHLGDQVRYKSKNKSSVKRLLIGSIWKIENTYSLSVKVINTENSKVLWGTVYNFIFSDLQKTCRDMIPHIVKHID